ncbi:unnamed protein product [Mucor circinelloides]|uniref:Uncharacterized protein n=1 Tax=Mucor circinelloides f. circinelloides (strain 1006PhL) TaxID=1220926 RepID=S2JQZ6_MUCC1|nr:hypothetical protein HMPREF1544_00692 [Mucor circinelloides 1006PhL]
MAWGIPNLLYRSLSQLPTSSVDHSPLYNNVAQKPNYSHLVDKLIDTTSSKFGYQSSNRSVDRKSLSQGVKLVDIAVDEFETGNEAIGLDVYLAGLDKIIMALPNLREIKTKEALKERLTSLEERVGIAAQQQQVVAGMESDEGYTDTIIEKFRAITRLAAPSWVIAMTQDNASSNINTDSNSVTTQYQQDAPIQKFKSLNKAMTDIVVHCVVLFKQSPVPGLLYSLLSYFLFAVLWLNDQFQIVERVQQLTIECIKLGLKADEKYHLHEFASEAVYSIVSAFLKAIIAYKEAPLHKHDTAPKSGPRL